MQCLKQEFLEASYDVSNLLKETRPEEGKNQLNTFNERFNQKCAIISRFQSRIDEALLDKAESDSLSPSNGRSRKDKTSVH